MSNRQPTLLRELGRWDLTAIGINQVIGGAIFLIPAQVAAQVGNWAPLALVAIGLASMCVALCFAEVGSRFEGTGGPYLYTRAAFGRFVAFEIGWMQWFTRATSQASIANGLALALGFYWPTVTSGIGRALVISAVTVGLLWINVRGIKQSAWLVNALTIGKLVPLFVFILGGLFFLRPDRLVPLPPLTLEQASTAALLLIFSFGGYDVIGVPAGEAKNPRQHIPFAFITTIAVVTAVFILAQVVAMSVLPDVAASRTPMADAAALMFGAAGALMISLGSVVSMTGNNAGQVLTGSRMLYALAENDELPRWFARVHPQYRTPHHCVIFTSAVALVLMLTGSFVFLAAVSAVARLICYVGACAAMVMLRRRRFAGEVKPATFVVPGGLVVPAVAIGSSMLILLLANRQQLLGGLAALVAGGAIFLLNALMRRTKMTRRAPGVVFFVVFLLASALPASAQLDTGAIGGTVRDAQGGVMPGVTVIVTQEGTGTSSSGVTDDRGRYLFPNLRIGTYTVAAELQGFRRAVRSGVPLNVQAQLEIDFALEVGNLAEEVVVSGRAELLDTQKADIGNVVDERQVRDLPLLGRRYAELAFLTPGVVAAPAGVTTRGEDTFFNVNGNMSTWNNFILDGADNNSFSTNLQERSPQVIQPPVDALQEFRVQTRTYSAEFGKAAGAVINASIKQGTNEFHGNAFWFTRDEAFNANRWENNRLALPKNTFNQHIAGGTLGGPIVRSKAFFFGSYQAQRLDRELTQQATVPTALMRQGNLSELTGTMRETAFAPGCVDAASKIVNPSCIDPVAAALLQYYPQPNIPAALAALGRPGGFVSPNYVMTGMLQNDVDQFDLRTDFNLDGNNQVFARYSFQDTTRHEPPVLGAIGSGDFNSDIFNRGQSAVGGWSRVIGNNMFNELRVSWNRISSSALHPAFGQDVNGQVGLRGVPDNPLYSGGLPHINITRFTRLGGPFFRPQFQTSQVYQFTDHFTWNRGSHAFKFGVEKRRDLVDYIDARALNGTLSFTDGRYTNYAFGDYLLGIASTQGLTLFFEPELYTDSWQFYGQDQWPVTADLTLSYGLRYEYFTPLFERQNRMTNIDPASGQILNASDGGAFERGLIRPDRNNFAPRVGVAWTMTPRMVWRGGYGIFYQQTDRYGSESQLAMNPPQLVDVNILANTAADAPAMILRNGFVPISAANINPALVQWRIQDPDQVTPWVQQFSLGPEYQISGSMVGALEYVGNITRNGRKLRNLNQGQLQPNGTVVFPYQNTIFQRAYLEQITTNGRGDFHSLQARLQKRMANGLAFTTSFTWGKALGNFLDHLSADGGGESGNFPKDAYNPDADYGPLAFDVRKRFVASFIYEVPVGRGRAVQPSGPLAIIASDWNVNGILTLSDGRPFSITATDLSGAGAGRISRANCVGDAMPDGFEPTVDQWFNTAAFAPTTAGTFGTCGPNTVVGPGQKTMNLSFFRSVPFSTAKRLELRWEIFNLFNTPVLGRPGQSVSNPATFGRITTTVGEPREMQFAVKFYF